VTFKDFGNTLGTGALDSTGVATLTTSSLAVGNHAITAAYGGDANFNPSASIAFGQTVKSSASLAFAIPPLGSQNSASTSLVSATASTLQFAAPHALGLAGSEVDHFFAATPSLRKLRSGVDEDWLRSLF
jgi:hypothetical protein